MTKQEEKAAFIAEFDKLLPQFKAQLAQRGFNPKDDSGSAAFAGRSAATRKDTDQAALWCVLMYMLEESSAEASGHGLIYTDSVISPVTWSGMSAAMTHIKAALDTGGDIVPPADWTYYRKVTQLLRLVEKECEAAAAVARAEGTDGLILAQDRLPLLVRLGICLSTGIRRDHVEEFRSGMIDIMRSAGRELGSLLTAPTSIRQLGDIFGPSQIVMLIMSTGIMAGVWAEHVNGLESGIAPVGLPELAHR